MMGERSPNTVALAVAVAQEMQSIWEATAGHGGSKELEQPWANQIFAFPWSIPFSHKPICFCTVAQLIKDIDCPMPIWNSLFFPGLKNCLFLGKHQDSESSP